MAAATNRTSPAATSENNSIFTFVQKHYDDVILYLTRIGTVFSCLAFVFSPLFSEPVQSWYHRALLANAATFALRLHQRLKALNTGGLSRVTLEVIVKEDSFHYLIYSVLFAFLPPITVCLVPIFFFALLNVASFTDKLLNISSPQSNAATGDGPNVATGNTQPSFVRQLVQTGVKKLLSNQESILYIAALNEIMLMLICVLAGFSGSWMVLLPLIYYPFLKMRYNSRRNPYTRIVFSELHRSLRTLAHHPRCPSFITKLILHVISVVSRLGGSNH